VTQADLEGGGVTNTATATGTDPGGRTVTADDRVEVRADPPAPPAPPAPAPPGSSGSGSATATHGQVPAGGLPQTGGDVTAASTLGLVALLAGAVLLAAERRSRRTAD
jgi:LPXTG-motif cell wall-anchored protein